MSVDPSKVADYNSFATAYPAVNETNLVNAYYERPAMPALAGDVAGQRILNAGCGSVGAGGLVTAGTAVAAPTAVAADKSVVPLEVVNLGLSTDEAKHLQCWLREHWGYTGAIDGLLGPESWRAFQRNLAARWGYSGPIDGIVGSGTISALQRGPQAEQGHTGPIDGIAGPETLAAIKRGADGWTYC